jgi:hypothetical protein
MTRITANEEKKKRESEEEKGDFRTLIGANQRLSGSAVISVDQCSKLPSVVPSCICRKPPLGIGRAFWQDK